MSQGEKQVVAVARLYRNVAIFQTLDGFVIYGEDKNQIPFVSQSEAEAFIDAYLLACSRLLVVGPVPMQ